MQNSCSPTSATTSSVRSAPRGSSRAVVGTRSPGFQRRRRPGNLAPAAQQLPQRRALPDGGFLIPDPTTSESAAGLSLASITTVAGFRRRGVQPLTAALRHARLSIALRSRRSHALDGSFLIAELGNRAYPEGRRRPAASRPSAGNGASRFSGDGVPATRSEPAVTLTTWSRWRDGSFLIADTANERVRRVDPAGVITTLMGTVSAAPQATAGLLVRTAERPESDPHHRSRRSAHRRRAEQPHPLLRHRLRSDQSLLAHRFRRSGPGTGAHCLVGCSTAQARSSHISGNAASGLRRRAASCLQVILSLSRGRGAACASQSPRPIPPAFVSPSSLRTSTL